jgi:hypothetical protein
MSTADIEHVRVTLSLDRDVLDWFKHRATLPGERRYQASINAALRTVMEQATLRPAQRREQLRLARRLIYRVLHRKRKKRLHHARRRR